MKIENDVPMQEAQMGQWQTNLAIMESKERQYRAQSSNYEVVTYFLFFPETMHEKIKLYFFLMMKALLKRVGYTEEINHGVLMEMAERKKELEKKTKPILETLRSYQDLPPVRK